MAGEIALHNAIKHVIPGSCLRPAINTCKVCIGVLIKVPHGLGNGRCIVNIVRSKC